MVEDGFRKTGDFVTTHHHHPIQIWSFHHLRDTALHVRQWISGRHILHHFHDDIDTTRRETHLVQDCLNPVMIVVPCSSCADSHSHNRMRVIVPPVFHRHKPKTLAKRCYN